MSETSKHIVDFSWEIMSAINEAEEKARGLMEHQLNIQLGGKVVRIRCWEKLGISAEPVLKDYIITISKVMANEKGYGITLLTDNGVELAPASPFGIEIIGGK